MYMQLYTGTSSRILTYYLSQGFRLYQHKTAACMYRSWNYNLSKENIFIKKFMISLV